MAVFDPSRLGAPAPPPAKPGKTFDPSQVADPNQAEPGWLERIGQYLTTPDPEAVKAMEQDLQANPQNYPDPDFNLRTIPSALRSIVEGLPKAGSDLVDWERANIPFADQILPAPLTDQQIEAPLDYGINVGARLTGNDPKAAIAASKYQPQTPEEQLVSTGIQFLPALYGGGGPLATKMLTRVAGPMAATEGAGEIAHNVAPDLEPAVRLLAGVLTAGRPLAPTRELAAAADALNVSQGGVRALADMLRKTGMPEAELRAKLGELGVDANLMDANPGVLQAGQQIYSKGGVGRDVLAETLTARDRQGAGDTQVSLRRNLGPEVNETATLDALQQRLSDLGEQQRQAARSGQTQPADVSSIVQEIDTRLATEKSPEVRRALEQMRDQLHIKKTAPTQPDVTETASEPILSTRQAIDESLYDASGQLKAGIGRKEKQARLDVRSKINEQLDVANPTLRAKDAEIEAAAKEKQAYGTGRDDVISKGGKTASPEEFAQVWDKMSTGERQTALKGLTRTIDEIVGTTGNDRVALKKIITGEGKWNHQKIAQVIGEEKAADLMRTLERQSVFQNTKNKVMENSKTAETTVPDTDPASIALARKAAKFGAGGGVVGGPVGAGLGMLAAGVDSALGGFGQRHLANLRGDLSRLISSGAVDEVLRARDLADRTRGLTTQRLLGAAGAAEDRR